MYPANVELEQLIEMQQRRRTYRKRIAVVFTAILLGSFVASRFWRDLEVSLVIGAVNFLNLILVMFDYRFGRRIDEQMEQMGEYSSVSSLGPLALALPDQTVDQSLLTRVLTRPLSKLKPSDGELLNADHRKALFGSLKRSPRQTADYLIALLGALEQLGDPDAVGHVERLADRVRGKRGMEKVASAAEECLEALRVPFEQKRGRETYLRSAAETPEALLRPAAASAQEPELLLREPNA